MRHFFTSFRYRLVDIRLFCGKICVASEMRAFVEYLMHISGRFELGEFLVEEKPSLLRGLFEKYREIIMYCIFGVITTIINWLVYSIYVRVVPANDYASGFPTWFQELVVSRLHLDIKLIYAGVIAWIVAVIVAFVTNKLWVFESKSWNAKLVLGEALTFFGGRIATGLLEVVAVPAFVAWGFDATLFGVDGLPAKIVVSVAIVILNYILSKFISFRSRESLTKDSGQDK